VTSPQAPRWQASLLALSVLLAWVAFWYRDTLAAMGTLWARSDTYAHGFVVPLIALWLVWRQRQQLACYQPGPTGRLLLFIAVFAMLWLLGSLAAINALTQFCVVAIIALSIMSLIGLRLSRRIAFPLAFLFFAVPIGDFMLPQLMEWTASFTVIALRASGIPVYREGFQFIIPSGSWSVVEACSGIRYIIASVTVGTLFAYLNYTSLKRRLAFVGVSILVPVVANWLRAYLIVLLGHLSNNKLAAGVDHLIYGWIFFGLVIAIMFIVGMRWSEPAIEHRPSPEQAQADFAAARAPWTVTIGLALLTAAAPFAASWLNRPEANPLAISLTLPSSAGWEATTPITGWKPSYGNPSAELQGSYRKGDTPVGLYIAYYRHQNFEHKLVTSTNALVTSNDKEWSITAQGSHEVELDGGIRQLGTAEISGKHLSSENRLNAWHWYWINGHLTSNDFAAKLYTALAQLSGRGDQSAIIVVYAPKESATTSLQAFVDAQGAAIHRLLERAGQP
jgi:exosortase A